MATSSFLAQLLSGKPALRFGMAATLALLVASGNVTAQSAEAENLAAASAAPADGRPGRHAVVADQGVGQHQDLAGIGGVGERLRVADHAGREHDLAGDRPAGTEGNALKDASVLEPQPTSPHAPLLDLDRAGRMGVTAGSGVSFDLGRRV